MRTRLRGLMGSSATTSATRATGMPIGGRTRGTRNLGTTASSKCCREMRRFSTSAAEADHPSLSTWSSVVFKSPASMPPQPSSPFAATGCQTTNGSSPTCDRWRSAENSRASWRGTASSISNPTPNAVCSGFLPRTPPRRRPSCSTRDRLQAWRSAGIEATRSTTPAWTPPSMRRFSGNPASTLSPMSSKIDTRQPAGRSGWHVTAIFQRVDLPLTNSTPNSAGSRRTLQRRSGEPAAVDPSHRDRIEVDAFQAPNVDGPCARVGSRSPERQDSAGWAEVVPRGVGVKRIQRQALERR